MIQKGGSAKTLPHSNLLSLSLSLYIYIYIYPHTTSLFDACFVRILKAEVFKLSLCFTPAALLKHAKPQELLNGLSEPKHFEPQPSREN